LSVVYAGVFLYEVIVVDVRMVSPPVVFDYPDSISLSCSVVRCSFNSVVYSDFESASSSWVQNGGSVLFVSGVKGRGVEVVDSDDGGIGGAVQYYYGGSVGGYSSLWLSSKVLIRGSGYVGYVLIGNGLNRLYEVSIYNDGSSWYLTLWYFRNTWTNIVRLSLPVLSYNTWYVFVLNYRYTGSSIVFDVYLYSLDGGLLFNTSYTYTRNLFQPFYIGLEVDNSDGVYDDFIASRSDPRWVVFNNLSYGFRYSIYDDLNILTYDFVSSGNSYNVSSLYDSVLGTGSGGRLEVYTGKTLLCTTQLTSQNIILGGETYNISITNPIYISITENSTKIYSEINLTSTQQLSFNLSKVNMSDTLNIRLVLDNSSIISSGLTVEINLSNSTTSIKIQSGNIISNTTNHIQAIPQTTLYITISNLTQTTGTTSILNLHLEAEYNTAKIQYPITIKINS